MKQRLFILSQYLLPHHLLVQVPENERCLVPQEASVSEMPPAPSAAAAMAAAVGCCAMSPNAMLVVTVSW